MKKMEIFGKKRLVRTTALAMFVATFLIISSAASVNIAVETTNNINNDINESLDINTNNGDTAKGGSNAAFIDGNGNVYEPRPDDHRRDPYQGPKGLIIFEDDFEDAWVADSDGDLAPPGWEVDIRANYLNGNGFPAYWSDSELSHSGQAPYVGFDNIDRNQSEWLISPSIALHPTNDSVLSFWTFSYGMEMPMADHNYVQITKDDGGNWTLLDDLSFNHETNQYEFPYTYNLDDYKGETIKVAFNREYLSVKAYIGPWAVDDFKIEEANLNDVGVTSIESPVSGEAGAIVPEVTVENFGVEFPEDVPVNLVIKRVTTPVTLFTEDFNGYVPEEDLFPPLGWSIINTSDKTWFKYSPTNYQRAKCQESGSTGAQDEWLITDTLDCSGLTAVKMTYYRYMSVSSSTGDSQVTVYGSIDDGATWNYTIATYTSSSSATTEEFDITSWAAGEPLVKIAFRFESTDDTGKYDNFYFDDFYVGYKTISGVTEDFDDLWSSTSPPTGWTIEDHGDESSPVWNNNDWHRYSKWGGYVARVYYSPSENQDEWLISPTVDCSGFTGTQVSFNHYYNYDSGDFGVVEGSIDNGLNWTIEIVNFTSDDGSSSTGVVRTYGISWADGESQVKIRFRYVANYNWYWYVDDFVCGVIDETIVYETTFDDVIPSSGFPPAGWWNYDYFGLGNSWIANDLSYEAPPDSTGYYAHANDASGVNLAIGLFTPIMNMSGVSGIKLEFDHKFDYWGPTDWTAVSVYSPGSTLNYLGDLTFYEEDLDEHETIIFDPSGFPDPSDVCFEFMYYDGGLYAEEWAIDNVKVSTVPLEEEYNEIVYVDMEKRQQTVTFPAWIPDNWQVTENEVIEYQVSACTQLGIDEDTSNDCSGPDLCYLTYPHMHDLGVTSINSPAFDRVDAQIFPVEVTVENTGQFPANAFEVNVQIGEYVPVGGITYITHTFEINDGGFEPSADWDPVGDWEWGVYDYGLYTGSHTPPPAAYSGTHCWGTVLHGDYTNAGGTSYLKKTIDLTGVTGAYMSFYSWADIFGNFDYGTITVNGVQEFYVDTYNPTAWAFETIDLSDYDGMASVEISFNLYTTTVVEYAGWYIDDVTIPDVETELIVEYDEIIVITEQLDPDETVDVKFPDWTPEDLQYGVSGTISYGIEASTDYNPDTNPDNDGASGGIILEYYHDVGIKEVTQPVLGRDILLEEDFDGTGVPTGWLNVDYDGDTWFWDCDWPYGMTGEAAGSASYINDVGPLNPDNWLILPAITGAGELSYWVAAQDPAWPSEHLEVWISTTGTTVPGDFTDQVDDYTETTDTWKERTVDLSSYSGETIYIAFRHCESYDNYWIKIDDVTVSGAGGQPGPDIFIQPGNKSIEAIVENLGVFPESGLTANAKIYSFNETGVPTKVYEDNVAGIELAVGAEDTAKFNNFEFEDEGIYQLDIGIELLVDDFPDNNEVSMGIAVDGTAPTSQHTIDPATPDGDNDWYVSDVTVSFTADDGTEDWQSGLDHIEYKVDTGSWQTGDSVVVSADGEHTVQYKAIDNVGNEETPNSVDFKIDQTAPTVDMTWESPDNENVVFTAACSDSTSGMDRVEFAMNDVVTFTDDAEPFEWTILWSASMKSITFKATAFDQAGNSAFDEILGEGISAVPVPHGQTTPTLVIRQTNSL